MNKNGCDATITRSVVYNSFSAHGGLASFHASLNRKNTSTAEDQRLKNNCAARAEGSGARLSRVSCVPSLRSLHDHSSSLRACATFALNVVLSSARLKPCCSSPIVWLHFGSPAARKRKPRRLRQEGTIRAAIMISDTRTLWHVDMIRSAAARLRGAKSATSVRGLVLTKWRLASTDAGRNETLGLHELECRRLQASPLSGFVEYVCLATAAGAECRVLLCSRVTTHSNDLMHTMQKQMEKLGSASTRLKKAVL